MSLVAESLRRTNGVFLNHLIRHRAGIVGAGGISEFHAAAIQRIPGVELLGFIDLDSERARKAAERFGVRAFSSLEELREAGGDVVHVATPPDTHAQITLRALELGMHVLVEKPLATDPDDCGRIEAAANERGLTVSVNHSMLFDPQVIRALEAVRAGKIGKIVSLDILRSGYFPGWDGGPLPPQYRSAGYPFRDLGVHELYLFEKFLGPIESVDAQWASLGGDKNLIFDEWRAQVRCRDGFGQFQLSWNIQPQQHLIIAQGTHGVLRVDAMRMFSAQQLQTKLPKPADRLLGIYSNLLAPFVDFVKSSVGVIRKKILPYHGLQEFVAAFYRSLDDGTPPPVTVAEATPVVEWLEKVARAAEAEAAQLATQTPILSESVPVVVTGAAGGVGSAVVRRLLANGERVRLFVRRMPDRVPEGAEICVGDLRDPAAVGRAIRGARRVVHAGAAMSGDPASFFGSTVVGTQNVIDACLENGVEQLVHISSMSCPQWAGTPAGAPMSESSPIDPRAADRDLYSRSKIEAERRVSSAVAERGLPAVILRPGVIFGGPLALVTPSAVGRKAGTRYIVFGDGTLHPPFVYLEDVVDAIVASLDRKLVGGEIIQVIDTDTISQDETLRRVAGANVRIVHVPRFVLFAMGKLIERVLGKTSPMSAYQLDTGLAKRSYVNENARLIGWRPRVGTARGIEIFLGRQKPEAAPVPAAAASHATAREVPA